jgi:predicted membrane protein
METQPINPEPENTNSKNTNNSWEQYEKDHKRGRVFGGILIIIIGIIFLLRASGVDFPRWVFSWKVLLIGIGFVIGLKHNFRRSGWIFPVIIGTVFLLIDWVPELPIKHYAWPILIIIGGIFFIFRSNNWDREKHWRRYNKRYRYQSGGMNFNPPEFGTETKNSNIFDDTTSNQDSIHSSAFMAGIKKNIISKDFKGGKISNILGGTEINLSQADIQDRAILTINQALGGTTLIIPVNWEVQTDVDSIMGSIEDTRPVFKQNAGDTKKVLIIRGTTFMGGIEIKGY